MDERQRRDTPRCREEDTMMLTATQRQALRNRLDAERERLRAVIRDLDAEVAALAAEATERSTLGNHLADVGGDDYMPEQALTLERHERALLDQVDRALARMDAGTYGRCEHCGQAIPVERLEAIPSAALCLACEVAAERAWGRPRPA
jgi:DnaK suppressor protein